MIRFIHAADIHLDSPLRGLARYEGAPLEELQGATRRAFTNLVTEALRLEVDFLLIAGDLYDGDWPDYNTGLFFAKEMSRLDRAGVPVVMVSGNHDAQSRITRALRLPANVKTLSAKKPETFVLEELGVAIHGQSFAQQAVTKDLTKKYPDPVTGMFNIGLLHTSADGRPGHDNYAPCSVETLKKFGYQYWALGHIHQREILSTEPWIVFCGNLQGRHVKESGPKGASLVTIEQNEVTEVEELVLDVVRWSLLRVDISDCEDEEAFLAEVQSHLRELQSEAPHRLLAFRVETVGRGSLHSTLSGDPEGWTNELRSLAVQFGPDIWFEKLKLRSKPAESSVEKDELAPDLINSLRERVEGGEDLQPLAISLFDNLSKKLPRAWRVGPQAFEPTEPDYLKSMAEDALGLLMERVSRFEGDGD